MNNTTKEIYKQNISYYLDNAIKNIQFAIMEVEQLNLETNMLEDSIMKLENEMMVLFREIEGV